MRAREFFLCFSCPFFLLSHGRLVPRFFRELHNPRAFSSVIVSRSRPADCCAGIPLRRDEQIKILLKKVTVLGRAFAEFTSFADRHSIMNLVYMSRRYIATRRDEIKAASSFVVDKNRLVMQIKLYRAISLLGNDMTKD